MRACGRSEQRCSFGYSNLLYTLYLNYEMLLNSTSEAIKNVSWKSSTQTYYLRRLIWVANTQKMIDDGKYKTKGYHNFTIHERGKARHIRSCHISDRVVQKAFNNNVLKPKIYPKLIFHNSASQKGKGTSFALKRLKRHLCKFYKRYGNKGYVLLLDFSNYFGSIDKPALVEKLAKILEPEELEFMSIFLANESEGLGLGSEINQTCAIFYANDLDHFVKEKLKIRYYGRYMDDSYLIHRDKKYLEYCLDEIAKVCEREKITLNKRKCKIVNLKSDYVNILKKQIKLSKCGKITMRPIRKNFTLRRRKLSRQLNLLEQGVITPNEIEQSYKSWRGFATKYDSPHHIIEEMDKLYAERSKYGHGNSKGTEADARAD